MLPSFHYRFIFQRPLEGNILLRSTSRILLILGLVQICQSSRRCTLGYRTHTLEYGDCIPRTILTRDCIGSCGNQGPRHDDLPNINGDNNCVRCEITEIVVRRVSLLCPDQNGRNRFVPKIFDLGVPHRCRCLSCEQGSHGNNITALQ